VTDWSPPSPTVSDHGDLFESVPSRDYHADDILDGTPTLSASIAHLLCTRTPLHAWYAHPKLNPNFKPDDGDGKFDIGTAAHALLLQGDDVAVVIDAADWRSKLAQEERDAARAAGAVPLLVSQWERVQAMAEAARQQLARSAVRPIPFTDGQPEQTLVWEEGAVVCRARLDWFRADHTFVDDYKSTSASADPTRWVRTMYGIGGDVQVAFYLRGCEKVLGVRPDWRFVVQETYPPYALSVVDLAPSALAVANDKVDYAIKAWRACLETDRWDGYDGRVASVELPTFEELRWMERDGQVAV
jgi:PDDEXK-like domain of unknown function (DUF3799)